MAALIASEREKAAAEARSMFIQAALCRRAGEWLDVARPKYCDLGPEDLAAAEIGPALRQSPATAAIRVRRALDIVSRLPNTLAAMAAGDLDLGRVLAIYEATAELDAADAFEVEATVLPGARDQTAGELRAALRRAVIAIDPKAAEKRRKVAVASRRVRRYQRPDGVSALEALLSAVDTGEIYELIDQLARASKVPGDSRSMDARRADALVFALLGRGPRLGPEDPPGPRPKTEPPNPDDEPTPPWHEPPGDIDDRPEASEAEQAERVQPDVEPPVAKPPDLEPPDPEQPAEPTVAEPPDLEQSAEPSAEPCVAEPSDEPSHAEPPDLESPDLEPPDLEPSGALREVDRSGEASPAESFVRDEPSELPDEPPDLDERFPPEVDPDTWLHEFVVRCLAAAVTRRPPDLPWVSIHHVVRAGVDVVAIAEIEGYGPTTVEAGRHLLDTTGARPPPSRPPDDLRSTPQTTAHDPPPALAALVQARDGTCRFPGCRRAARRCDLDHTIRYPDGPTTYDNLAALCRRHHRIKDHTKWTVVHIGEAMLEWTSPTGRVYRTYPRGFTGAWCGTTTSARSR